jgi:hypothetical protein
LDVLFDDFFAAIFLETDPFLTVSLLGFLDCLVRLPLAIMALPFINMLHILSTTTLPDKTSARGSAGLDRAILGDLSLHRRRE